MDLERDVYGGMVGAETVGLPAPGGDVLMLTSCLCTQAQLQSDTFQAWAVLLGEKPMRMHRKVWEWCYIAQALQERGMLGEGRRGLGFGVGREPLAAMFAALGCEVVATDAPVPAHWAAAGMYAGSLDALNERGLCEAEPFCRRVQYRAVDMRALPPDLGEFDFVWSACALEHLGSLAAGEQFLLSSLWYLRPGGAAVHTTEYNVGSDGETLATGDVVLYRRQDVLRMAGEARVRGYLVGEPDLGGGNGPWDNFVLQPPYKDLEHLRISLGGYTSTSVGLIVERPA